SEQGRGLRLARDQAGQKIDAARGHSRRNRKESDRPRTGGSRQHSHGGNMPDRVIVEVDEDLSDLIPGFLAHKRTDIDSIFEAVARRDYAAIGRIAHRIKGEGGSYGFDSMTEMGRSLEHAAAIRDNGSVTTLARQLLRYLDQ